MPIYDVNKKKSNNIVIKDNTNNIMCDFSKFAPTPPNGGGVQPPPITPLPPIPEVIEPPIVNTGILGNKNVLIGGAVIASLFVLFLLFIMTSKSDKTE